MADLRDIKDLVTCVDNNVSELYRVDALKESVLALRLYEEIKSDEVTNDEEAAASIYAAAPGDDRYRKLKSFLRQKLINLIPTAPINTHEDASQFPGHDSIMQELYVSNILIAQRLMHGAKSTLKSVINNAERYGATAQQLEALSQLRLFYTVRGTLDELKATMQEERDLLTRRQVENKAEQYLSIVSWKLTHALALESETKELLKTYLAQTAAFKREHNSIKLNIIHFQMQIMAHQALRNFDKCITACADAARWYAENPHLVIPVRLGHIYLSRMECHMLLHEYNEAQDCADRCREYFPPGKNNWFRFQLYHFRLRMHLGEYNTAADIFREISSHPRFELQPETVRQEWRIHQLYLGLVRPEENRDTDDIRQGLDLFKKDKAGWNAALWILRYLYHLRRREYSELIDLQETMQQYRRRHLGANPRAALLLQMFGVALNKSFHRADTERYAQKYLARLRKEQEDDIEVIPFEKLWALALDMMNARTKHRPAAAGIGNTVAQSYIADATETKHLNGAGLPSA